MGCITASERQPDIELRDTHNLVHCMRLYEDITSNKPSSRRQPRPGQGYQVYQSIPSIYQVYQGFYSKDGSISVSSSGMSLMIVII